MWTAAAVLIVSGSRAPEHPRPRAAGVDGLRDGARTREHARACSTVVFYLVITPVGAIMRLFHDPLDRSLRDGRRSHWVKRQAEPFDPERYERQF